MNFNNMDNPMDNESKQQVQDAYSRIINHIITLQSNSLQGRADDKGKYDASYYDAKDIQDSLNDIRQLASEHKDTSKNLNEYIVAIGRELQFYENPLVESVLTFVKSTFGIEISKLTEDEKAKEEYMADIEILAEIYGADIKAVLQKVPYNIYSTVSSDEVDEIMRKNFEG
jgi:hypothetical protein